MTNEPQKTPPIPVKIVPLTWEQPGVAAFTNHAVAQYDGKSVYVTFGQAGPPVIFGRTDEEREQQLQKIEMVPVIPIIRLVMSAEGFRDVARVFQQHLETMDRVDKQEKP